MLTGWKLMIVKDLLGEKGKRLNRMRTDVTLEVEVSQFVEFPVDGSRDLGDAVQTEIEPQEATHAKQLFGKQLEPTL